MFQILIVDDDTHTRRWLGAVLTAAGYCPHAASSAREALSLMQDTHVDLVVLDVMMPGMDGYEFTSLLRDCRCDLPILMLSARQLPDNIKHGFLAGTDDYMTKPADEEELLLPQKEFYLCISFSPIRTRSSPVSSCWRISGDRIRTPCNLQSVYISTG